MLAPVNPGPIFCYLLTMKWSISIGNLKKPCQDIVPELFAGL